MVSALMELKVCRDNISIQKYLQFNVIDLMVILKASENMKREIINLAFDIRKRNSS